MTPHPDRDEILGRLREEDPDRLAALLAGADRVRAATVGAEVHLRGLIEFGNVCRRDCLYCGLRRGHDRPLRYRMAIGEILGCVARADELRYGTVVLQSGEDPGTGAAWLASLIRRIREDHPRLAITLSVGEREPEELRLWREAGADRYLLRFETGDATLFRRLHPPLRRRGGCAAAGEAAHPRLALLGVLRDLGYEVGSGIMVGLPGQTWRSVADDLQRFAALDLDMIGIGTYVPHPGTPLGRQAAAPTRAPARTAAPTAPAASAGRPAGDRAGAPLAARDQVPATALATLKVLALTRLLCPEANLPATHAAAGVCAEGHLDALRCGANVLMPDLTPPAFRRQYDIYPSRLRLSSSPAGDAARVLAALGRPRGSGRGDRVRRDRSRRVPV